MSLRPCPECHRHVRASEAACPFCASTLAVAQDADAAVAPAELGAAVAAPSRHSMMFGVAVGAIAVSTALFGSACFAYGPPSPDLDAGAGRDAASNDAPDEPDAGR